MEILTTGESLEDDDEPIVVTVVEEEADDEEEEDDDDGRDEGLEVVRAWEPAVPIPFGDDVETGAWWWEPGGPARVFECVILGVPANKWEARWEVEGAPFVKPPPVKAEWMEDGPVGTVAGEGDTKGLSLNVCWGLI